MPTWKFTEPSIQQVEITSHKFLIIFGNKPNCKTVDLTKFPSQGVKIVSQHGMICPNKSKPYSDTKNTRSKVLLSLNVKKIKYENEPTKKYRSISRNWAKNYHNNFRQNVTLHKTLLNPNISATQSMKNLHRCILATERTAQRSCTQFYQLPRNIRATQIIIHPTFNSVNYNQLKTLV